MDHQREGAVFQKPVFDFSGAAGAPIEPEAEADWASDVIHYANVRFDAGQPCSCNMWAEQRWSKWSKCSSGAGQCYQATQTRQRNCASGCKRIEVRYCLHQETCTGTWQPWIVMNNSCTECATKGKRTLIRFCVSDDGEVGPYCMESRGKSYQVKEEECYHDCENDLSWRAANVAPSSAADSDDSQYPFNLLRKDTQNNGGGLDGKSYLIIILLAVLAGVLLVALIFVSVALRSNRKRQKTGRSRRGMSRDLRSVSESNISATSFLSVADRESKASGRPSMYQRHKGGGSGRSLISPLNHIASVSMMGNGSVRVRAPMQHTDSLMLARKQISKRSSKGSVRSINKLMKERFRLDRSTAEESDDTLFIGSINLRGDGEVILTGKRENIPKRRATVGAGDFKGKDMQGPYFTGGMRKSTSKEMPTSSVSDQEYSEEHTDKPLNGKAELASDSSSSMEAGEDYNDSNREKRLSVDDIRKIFENRATESDPAVRSYAKTTADIPHSFGAVNENISRFEQATVASRNGHHSLDRDKGSAGRGVKRSTTMVIGSRLVTPPPAPISASTRDVSGVESTQFQKDSDSDEIKPENQNGTVTVLGPPPTNLEPSTEQHAGYTLPLTKNKKTDQNTNTEKPKQRTFLFSPQAYNSLKRSTGSHPNTSTPQAANKTGFKMNMDALLKSANSNNRAKGDKQRNGVTKKSENSENIRPRSFHDSSGNAIIIPPPRGVRKASDSDTYADVWDAKVKNSDEGTNGGNNIYADVWDSDVGSVTSRTSVCEDDDGDYSEVYDSLNSSRRRRSLTKPRGRQPAPGTSPQGGTRPSATHKLLKGSFSSGSPSPSRLHRPPLPFTKRRLSRDSSTGSDGSAANTHLKVAPTNMAKRRSAEILIDASGPEPGEDPIYCVI